MSAPESTGVLLRACAADVVEIAALRAAGGAPAYFADPLGRTLPACGQVALRPDGVALAVRPGRWLVLTTPAAGGVAAAAWQSTVGDSAAVIDLSSALTALHLGGRDVRQMLARGCRLDLDPRVFAPGAAAATVIAQVSVILAALRDGLLLLTPTSTAQYFEEWLASTGRPFALARQPGVTVGSLSP